MTYKHFQTLTLVAALTALAIITHNGAARSAEIKIIAPNAVKEAVVEIGKRYSKDTNAEVSFTWTGSEAITKRVGDGEVYDVVLTTSAGIDRLAGVGKLDATSKTNLSRSAVAAAIRSGLPRPEISTGGGGE